MKNQIDITPKIIAIILLVNFVPIIILNKASAEGKMPSVFSMCKDIEHRIMGEILAKYPEKVATAVIDSKNQLGRVFVGNAIDDVIIKEILKNQKPVSTFWYSKYEKFGCLDVTACEGGQCWLTADPNSPYLVHRKR
jgi:hypothetical protein